MARLRFQFGERLKELRIERHLTQEELADKANLSAVFISNLERGINTPSFASLESIADALNVSAKDLFDF